MATPPLELALNGQTGPPQVLQFTFSICTLWITFFPASPTIRNAALFNTTHPFPTPTTRTVTCLRASKFVTRTEVPIGNVDENAPGSPPTSVNPTVAPSQTTCPTTPDARTRADDEDGEDDEDEDATGAGAFPTISTRTFRRTLSTPPRPESGDFNSSCAALFNNAHDDARPATGSVTDRELARFVIRSEVPTGNWSEYTAADPPTAVNSSGFPVQTSLPATEDCDAGAPEPARAKAVPPTAPATANTPAAAIQPLDQRMCNTRPFCQAVRPAERRGSTTGRAQQGGRIARGQMVTDGDVGEAVVAVDSRE